MSRGLGSSVRGYPYLTVSTFVRRVGKKKSTELTHSDDGWWRANHSQETEWAGLGPRRQGEPLFGDETSFVA